VLKPELIPVFMQSIHRWR